MVSTKGAGVMDTRQSQLQEMVFTEPDLADKLAEMISYFYGFCMTPYRQSFTSMEQLWLAFVMKERYSKQWLTNSQEWVKI